MPDLYSPQTGTKPYENRPRRKLKINFLPTLKPEEPEKIAAAADYCSGQLGLKIVATRHCVDVSSLRKWVSIYRVHGASGLRRKRRRYHSVESRIMILTHMRDEGLSYRKTAALFNIQNFNILKKWEQQHQVGTCPARDTIRFSPKRDNDKKDERSAETRAADEVRIRDLVTEIDQLRMENAYLKKLNALAQANKRSAQREERKPC